MDLLLKISIVLFVGVIGGRLAKYLKLPNVTGYLVAGLFIGASFLGTITEQDMASFSIVNEVALAAIAFSIGSEFVLKDMLKVGSSILIITIAEAIGAVILVFIVTYYGFNQSFAFSIVIASMSAATAPAATMMVIRQYKAHGPLTRTILPVVAIDDAVGIMLFGLAMSLAKISIDSTSHSFLQMISAPIIEILGSLLLGFLLGAILTFVANRARSKEELLSTVLASIAASTGLANLLNLSPLLTCMMLGATLVNLMHNSNRVFTLITDFTPPIYLLFFTLAGASLDLGILAQVGALGVGYVIARATGKILGAFLGAKAVNADDAVVKYLGLSLLPQGGVSIGLSIIVKQELPQFAAAITTVILFSVLVYEISGPILAKIAIEKAGEVDGLNKVSRQAC
ncbi:sodium/hydrogen exchanger family protein [Clostridium argentinense CDC 2741]|uniref:Sodium/hydrogen exchanger family protein n=1 Tax=Clostridium argentinense CDC 2741 TaxID=1418104 RepID=A0A0C1U878_9CLOT|nr:cation:proton antiporter [Clostridium argentinense]ARC86128.1 sodium:proton exchanger [Clostridium argentinense]KIE47948.1 sodium/hydrogen exchanger family protein [Clostridium argentinense CDC 2741]NFF40361.1 cation:proton antiporter [Clostridium argentinense]NFP50168.1 cation:proton antiporter [Clostridium argentinense]NFP72683.1 cation:proton antiporter [Clostridium argentinense]